MRIWRPRHRKAGDDALEEFIDHRPNDAALPAVFAKLDELYRMERKPSTNELQRWARDPAQPRQVLAQWYLARSALRSGDREKAIASLTQLRDSPVRLPSLGEADLELARLQLARQQWDAADRRGGGGAKAKLRSGVRGAGGLVDCGSELPQRPSRAGRYQL